MSSTFNIFMESFSTAEKAESRWKEIKAIWELYSWLDNKTQELHGDCDFLNDKFGETAEELLDTMDKSYWVSVDDIEVIPSYLERELGLTAPVEGEMQFCRVPRKAMAELRDAAAAAVQEWQRRLEAEFHIKLPALHENEATAYDAVLECLEGQPKTRSGLLNKYHAAARQTDKAASHLFPNTYCELYAEELEALRQFVFMYDGFMEENDDDFTPVFIFSHSA